MNVDMMIESGRETEAGDLPQCIGNYFLKITRKLCI